MGPYISTRLSIGVYWIVLPARSSMVSKSIKTYKEYTEKYKKCDKIENIIIEK